MHFDLALTLAKQVAVMPDLSNDSACELICTKRCSMSELSAAPDSPAYAVRFTTLVKIMINATKKETVIKPIKEGQEIFIVIGEDLNEEVVNKYWD